jgi:hypothetical protein
MGYERNRVFLLTFEDPDLAGLEVRAKSASTGQLMSMMDLMELTNRDSLDPGDIKRMDKLFRTFAGCPDECVQTHEDLGGEPGVRHYISKIKSWNLEEDGIPVPPTYEGLMDQDMEFVVALVFAWMDGQVGTPGELGKDSNDGGRSVEVSIPMEPLSPVHLS